MATRDEIRSALLEAVIPPLRERGFTGRFPDLRRERESGVDLISFGVDARHGAISVRLGVAPPEGVVFDGVLIPPSRLRLGHLPADWRTRVGPEGLDEPFLIGDEKTEEVISRIAAALDRAEEIFSSVDFPSDDDQLLRDPADLVSALGTVMLGAAAGVTVFRLLFGPEFRGVRRSVVFGAGMLGLAGWVRSRRSEE